MRNPTLHGNLARGPASQTLSHGSLYGGRGSLCIWTLWEICGLHRLLRRARGQGARGEPGKPQPHPLPAGPSRSKASRSPSQEAPSQPCRTRSRRREMLRQEPLSPRHVPTETRNLHLEASCHSSERCEPSVARRQQPSVRQVGTLSGHCGQGWSRLLWSCPEPCQQDCR